MDRKSITRFRKSLEARHRDLHLSVVQTQKEMLTAQHDNGKDEGDRANTSLAKAATLAPTSV
jgi:RNA polymerase-binding transcription factor DksA